MSFTGKLTFLCLLTLIAGCQTTFGRREADTPEEIFFRKTLPRLKGTRICLISNQSGLGAYLLYPSSDSASFLHSAIRDVGADLISVFTPEHGLSGQEELHGNSVQTRVPVTGLYEASESRMKTLFAECETIVFDLPDSGVRPYTYRTVLSRTQRALHPGEKKLVIIDRPNPAAILGPLPPVVLPRFYSYVGEEPIAFYPARTYGELALAYHEAYDLQFPIEVQRLRKYDPDASFPDNQFDYPAPSPALPDFRAVQCYWFGIFMEGLQVEEGRGTRDPFCIVAHPRFTASKLPPVPEDEPVRWHVIQVKPDRGRFKDRNIMGYRLEVLKAKWNPARVSYEFIRWLLSTWPEESWLRSNGKKYPLDTIAGTDSMRIAIQAGQDYKQWEKEERIRLKAAIRYMNRRSLYD